MFKQQLFGKAKYLPLTESFDKVASTMPITEDGQCMRSIRAQLRILLNMNHTNFREAK
jgi:hypothetical protein